MYCCENFPCSLKLCSNEKNVSVRDNFYITKFNKQTKQQIKTRTNSISQTKSINLLCNSFSFNVHCFFTFWSTIQCPSVWMSTNRCGGKIFYSVLLPCHCTQLVPDSTQTVYHGVQCLFTQLHCNCGLTWTAANARSVLELHRNTYTELWEVF